MMRTKYTSEEIEKVRTMRLSGATWPQCASTIGRHPKAVKTYFYRERDRELGLKKRKIRNPSRQGIDCLPKLEPERQMSRESLERANDQFLADLVAAGHKPPAPSISGGRLYRIAGASSASFCGSAAAMCAEA